MSMPFVCQHAACGRSLPRKTAYCPYCGAGQQVSVEKTASEKIIVPATTTTGGQMPIIASPVEAREMPPAPPSAPVPPPSFVPPRPAPTQIQPMQLPKPGRSHGWRWLVIGLVMLGVWSMLSQSGRKADNEKVRNISDQISACQLDAARQSLSALRKSDPQHYRQLQNQLQQAKADCDSQRARARDWSVTLTQVDKALGDVRFDKAQYDKLIGRLAWFTKRWNEDAQSRDLKRRIDARYAMLLLEQGERCWADGNLACAKQRLAQWERFNPTEGQQRASQLRSQLKAELKALATPSAPSKGRDEGRKRIGKSAAQPVIDEKAAQAKQWLKEAEDDIARGSYKAAADKMALCIGLAGKEQAACQQLKKKAERMNKELLRCVSGGHEWVADHCEKNS